MVEQERERALERRVLFCFDLSLGIILSLLDLVGLHRNAVTLGVDGLLGLGDLAPGLGKGLRLFLERQVSKLTRLTKILGVQEEVGKGTLGSVGVLQRGKTLATVLSQSSTTLVLELIFRWRQLIQAILGLLLECGKVGLVLVLVSLLDKNRKGRVS